MSLVCYGSSGESSDEECEASPAPTQDRTAVNVSDEILRDNTNRDHSDKLISERLNTDVDGDIQEHGESVNVSRNQSELARTKVLNKKKSLRDKIKADLFKNIPFPAKRKDSNEPVLISIPSLPLDDFEDEEVADNGPKMKRLKSTQSSGLFSILPPPKHSVLGSKELNRPLIPHSVSKSSKSLSQKSIEKYSKTAKTTSVEENNSIESCNYFSLSEDKDTPVSQDDSGTAVAAAAAAASVSSSNYMQKIAEVYKSANTIEVQNESQYEHEQTFNSYTNQYYPTQEDCSTVDPQLPAENNVEAANSTVDPMQDEKFLKMMGKKKGEAIEFIDIDASEQLAKPDEWQTKLLTEERPVSSRKNTNQPNSQQRRKHQITYLAFQAKQRELELKNTWAQNRMTRKQTQAKYGF